MLLIIVDHAAEQGAAPTGHHGDIGWEYHLCESRLCFFIREMEPAPASRRKCAPFLSPGCGRGRLGLSLFLAVVPACRQWGAALARGESGPPEQSVPGCLWLLLAWGHCPLSLHGQGIRELGATWNWGESGVMGPPVISTSHWAPGTRVSLPDENQISLPDGMHVLSGDRR